MPGYRKVAAPQGEQDQRAEDRAFDTGSCSVFASLKTMTSSGFGCIQMKMAVMMTITSVVGMRTNGAKTVSLNGITWPVSFSTRFNALPCDACDKAIELDNPLLQTDHAE